MEKLANCKDCGHKGEPKVRLSGKIFLLIPAIFVGLILLLINPIVGVVAFLLAYFLLRVSTCIACGSENVVVEVVPKQSDATPPQPKEKGAIEKWIDKKAAEGEAQQLQELRTKSFVDSIKRKAGHDPVQVVILGGAGWESKKGEKRLLSIDTASVSLSNLQALATEAIPVGEFTDIEISGPGKVTSDLGMMGGGFGAEGALKGIAIATAINLLTTHSNTKTIIRLGTKNSELVMLTSQIEPDQARLLLSPIFVRLKNTKPETRSSSISDEIQKLHALKQSDVISEDEFLKLKQNLIEMNALEGNDKIANDKPSESSHALSKDSCQEDAFRITSTVCSKPIIDSQQSVGELLDEAVAKGQDERSLFEAALRQYFRTEHLVSISDIMKLTKPQKMELERIMQNS